MSEVAQESPSLESLVAEVVDEFRSRCALGERPEIEEYTSRHPHAATLLREVLASLQLVNLAAVECVESGGPALGELGDFRIIREVGRGGMGVVYEAEQTSLGRRVALKVLPFAATMDPRQLLRFQNEARAAAYLDHPHIVKVYAVGCERGVHYYAMQLIEGQSLEALLKEMSAANKAASPEAAAVPDAGPTADPIQKDAEMAKTTDVHAKGSTLGSLGKGRDYFRRVAEIGIQAAEALEHAHQLGVIHRDIKPENLILDGRGNVWITDFGLAQFQRDTKLTMTGDLVGTLRYMSPEQALAKRVIVDHRTDIYSLGATLYELLTLKPVFSGKDRQELLRQIAFEETVSARKLNRAVPIELETIAGKALEKNPQDRYGAAKEMADDLQRFLNDEPTLARRPSLFFRLRKWSRRHVAAVRAGAAAGIVIALALAATAGWWLNDQARREAETERAVNVAMEDSIKWQREGKLREALEAAKRAEAVILNGNGSPNLGERIGSRLNDLSFILELETIRAYRAAIRGSSTTKAITETDQRYANAFKAFGINVESLTPSEIGAMIRQRSVAVELATALDGWSWALATSYPPPKERLKHLLEAASHADSDATRNQLRELLAQDNKNGLDKFLESIRLKDLPPQTALLCAQVLKRANKNKEAVNVLLRAQQRHADDYWLNHELAAMMFLHKTDDLNSPLRFFTAAAALRPDMAVNHDLLGAFLLDSGYIDQAILAFREAIRLQPDEPSYHATLAKAYERIGWLDDAMAERAIAGRLDTLSNAPKSNAVPPKFNPAQSEFGLDVIEAWKKAGAEPGWMGSTQFIAVSRDWSPTKNAARSAFLPAFRLRSWPQSGLQSLPAPAIPFALVVENMVLVEANVKEIATLELLSELDLCPPRYSRIAPKAQEQLSGLRHVKCLRIGGAEITDATLSEIALLTHLQELVLVKTSVTDAGLAQLERMTDLKSLEVSRNAQISERGISQLAKLRQLQVLKIQLLSITDAVLKELASSNLKALDIAENPVTDAGMKDIAKMSQLQELALQGTQVTDGGLRDLAQLKGLKKLGLSRTQVTDVGLKELRGLTELESLWLNSLELSDEGMKNLAGLHRLQHLELAGPKLHVTDQSMKLIGDLTSLRMLRLQGVQLTDAGLGELARLKELRGLSLSNTKVTDAAVRHLTGFTKLEYLMLGRDSLITEKGIAELRAAFPDLTLSK